MKPLDGFHRLSSSPDGRQPRCKSCACEVARNWYLANRTSVNDSRRHEYAEARAGGLIELSCEFCGKGFVCTARKQAGHGQRYCSRDCKGKARNAARQAAINDAKPERKCIHCGTDMPREMRANAKFCSEKCNSAAHHLKRGNGRLGPGRRREIERAYIIERDAGRCHVCGKKCRADEIHLDHLIPVAAGGAHAPENLAVACARCNLSRGARGAAQLLLMG